MATCKLSKTERKEIEALISALDEARAALSDKLSDLKAEWEEAFDERSERWQDSEAGEEAKERLDTLEGWVDEIEDLPPGGWDLDELV